MVLLLIMTSKTSASRVETSISRAPLGRAGPEAWRFRPIAVTYGLGKPTSVRMIASQSTHIWKSPEMIHHGSHTFSGMWCSKCLYFWFSKACMFVSLQVSLVNKEDELRMALSLRFKGTYSSITTVKQLKFVLVTQHHLCLSPGQNRIYLRIN